MKRRLDQILVMRGLAESRSKAQTLIMTGNVLIRNRPVTKPGTIISMDVQIVIKEQLPYVSRGGVKLKGAIDHFGINFKDQVVLDVGASTGGFTDCLLQEGAKQIFCIDVGSNQLHEKLRNHPQVTWKEQFHVDRLMPDTFGQDFDWIVMDVSFISMLKVVKYLVRNLAPQGQMLLLFKPQFEVDRKHLNNGVLKDPDIREEKIAEHIEFLYQKFNFKNIERFDCTIKGPKGNQESFLWIRSS